VARVYSVVIYGWHAQVGDSDPIENPSGELWIIRDISCWNGNLAEVTDSSITTNDEIAICHTNANEVIGQYWFHQEGRWVIPPGNFLQFHATFPVDWYVSGYSLSLP
jgi:hypothetical protein